MMTLAATVAWEHLGSRPWDVVVVGAGPAGSMAALRLARQGLDVLLVDRSAFPRWKVCGCCLNGSALTSLDKVGVCDLTRRLNAVPLSRALLASTGRQASIRLNQGVALSRMALDAALVEAAIQAGAHFLPETTASMERRSAEARSIRLRRAGSENCVTARVVLAADGLGARLLAGEPGFRSITQAASRIGAGAITGEAPDFYSPGTVFLTGGAGGYLGLVRLEDGRLDLAAALDRVRSRHVGGPGPAAEALLHEAGWPAIPGLAELSWRGTLPLTRRARKPAGERLFVVGDAAGYVEPFTGEGIAWALASATAVAPIAAEAARRWQPSLATLWARRQQRLLGTRQRVCRAITAGMRRPALVRFCLSLLSRWPSLAMPLVRSFNAPAFSSKGFSS
jgi:flavin-dependent dehydrogenase